MQASYLKMALPHEQGSADSKASYLMKPDASCSASELAPICYASTLSSAQAENTGLPPSLEYDFVRRHRSLCINVSVIVIVNTAAPTLAFYLSRHLSDDSPATTYTWVTLALGVGMASGSLYIAKGTLTPCPLLRRWSSSNGHIAHGSSVETALRAPHTHSPGR